MSNRRDYYRDPNAPKANSLVPGGSAPIIDDTGAILMQRRADSGNWSLPSGTMEIGETLEQRVVRETREEPPLGLPSAGISERNQSRLTTLEANGFRSNCGR
ncbi:NUDIX domain-containing protein [Nocardia sp. NBC_00508]|nr:NUDIX domain-containing protein [Nocardia sp. NBC_00508]